MSANQWLIVLAGVVGVAASGYELLRRYQRWKAEPTEQNEQEMDRMARLTLVFVALVASVWLGIPDIFGS